MVEESQLVPLIGMIVGMVGNNIAMLTFFVCCRFVYVWDAVTQRLEYKLPGHLGSVNDVHFHPKEPISK